MKEKKSGGGGCIVLVVLGVVALVIGAGVLGVMFYWQKNLKRHEAETVQAAREQVMSSREPIMAQLEADAPERRASMAVHLSMESMGSYSPSDFGPELTREHFVAIMAAHNATTLARETFAREADGRVVRWLVRTSQVSEAGEADQIEGRFSIPYGIQTGRHSSASGSLDIDAGFSAGQRSNLLGLRRGDWVTVEGRLKMGGRNARLLDARIVPSPDTRSPGR